MANTLSFWQDVTKTDANIRTSYEYSNLAFIGGKGKKSAEDNQVFEIFRGKARRFWTTTLRCSFLLTMAAVLKTVLRTAARPTPGLISSSVRSYRRFSSFVRPCQSVHEIAVSACTSGCITSHERKFRNGFGCFPSSCCAGSLDELECWSAGSLCNNGPPRNSFRCLRFRGQPCCRVAW